MSKYGGPFTVEEVEDVKTVLRLLPIIFCTGGCNVGVYIGWEKLLIETHLFGKCKDVLAYSNLFHLLMVICISTTYDFLCLLNHCIVLVSTLVMAVS